MIDQGGGQKTEGDGAAGAKPADQQQRQQLRLVADLGEGDHQGPLLAWRRSGKSLRYAQVVCQGGAAVIGTEQAAFDQLRHHLIEKALQ